MRTLILAQGPSVRRAMLIGLVAGVPIFFLRVVNDPINVPKFVLLVVGISLVVAIRVAEIIQGASATGVTRVIVPAAAIAIPLVVAWVFTPYKSWALFGQYGRFQGLVPYLLVILLGLLVADAFPGHEKLLAWAFAGAGGFVGGYALIQAIGADPFTWVYGTGVTQDATSSLGNPNFTGGFLAISMPITVGLWTVEKDRRNLARNLALLSFGGWIVAESLGGWGAGVAGLALIGGFALTPRWRHSRLGGVLVAAAVALGVVGSVVFTMVASTDLAPETITARGWWWQAAAGVAADSPVVGRGPNVFALEGVQHRPVEDAGRFGYNFPDDPHSVFFALLTGAGVLGAAGYLVALGWVARRVVTIEASNLLGAGFLGGSIAYFVQSLVSIDELSIRVAFWAALGGVASATMVVGNKKKVGRSAKSKGAGKRRAIIREPIHAPVAVITTGLAALSVCVWATMFGLADWHARRGKVLFAEKQPELATREYERAIALRGDTAYRHQLGVGASGSALALIPDGDEFYRTTRLAFDYVDDIPHVPSIVDYARFLHDWGNRVDRDAGEQSIALYERAVELDPLNPRIREEIAQLYIDLKRYEAVTTSVDAYLDRVGFTNAILWGALAYAHAQLGDEPAAREAAQRALSIDSEQPLALKAQRALETRDNRSTN